MAPGEEGRTAPRALETPTLTVEALVAALRGLQGKVRRHLATGTASSPQLLEVKEMSSSSSASLKMWPLLLNGQL